MNYAQIEVLSSAVNQAVVRLPGRSFPGVVLQGDSLWNLCSQAKVIRQLCKSTDAKGVFAVADAVCAELEELVAHYETVLQAHNIALP